MFWSSEVAKFSDSTIAIEGTVFPTKIGELDHADLNFYIENPRVYTAIYSEGKDPEQSTVQSHMCNLSHVSKLKNQIIHHKGLLEPIIVRDKTFDVLEGNSRLAAYRLLKGKREYQKMRCIVLPSDIPEKYIFAYLGQIHINGKTPWALHEKARYLQRERDKQQDMNVISKAVGITPAEGKKMITALELMQNSKDENNENFSYYMAFLSTRTAQKAVEQYPKLAHIIVDEIKNDTFTKALDFRDALKPVCSDNTALKNLLNKKIDLADAKDFVDDKGSTTEVGKRVRNA